jgi:catechol 2,3-dioxygenase-like lactoylglutathione lyase family enzyme
MQFGYTLLYVPDVRKSVEFYEIAFGLFRRFVAENAQYAEMETGGTALGFVHVDLAHANLPSDGFRENRLDGPPAGIEIGFVTPDVPEAFRRAVDAGARAVAEPKTKPWGQVVAYVRDLDGVLVELASPMEGP